MNYTVTIILSIYNNQGYLAQALESIINQTYTNWELIITNDASTDNSLEIAQSYAKKDNRIKLLNLEKNQGISGGYNNCIKHACPNSKYIAIFCADDLWHNNKLQQQISYFESNNNPNLAVLFTEAEVIDHNNNKIPNHSIQKRFDSAFNTTRHSWLNRFFYRGNCLCFPSALIKKDMLDNISAKSYFNMGLQCLLDLDLWIRFLLKYDIHILDQKLTSYRIQANNGNASSPSLKASIRNKNELKHVLNNYKQINNYTDLIKIFPDCDNFSDNNLCFFYLALQALNINKDKKPHVKAFGVDLLFEVLDNYELVQHILNTTNYKSRDLYNFINTANIYTKNKSNFKITIKKLKNYISSI